MEKLKTYLGIELGSTRIKAVLIDGQNKPVAQGGFTWDNRFENGVWTYPLEEAWDGIRAAVKELLDSLDKSVEIAGLGVSAMMHGYLPFDQNGTLLTPFRTWRNTFTQVASAELSELFECNIPQRWSIAHLYHAVLQKEAHVKDIHHINTLEGYIHHMLTDQFVIGVGEASGMFPLDGFEYSEKNLAQFDALVAKYDLPWKVIDLLPAVRMAGEDAGTLTVEGAKRLDPSGRIKPGIPVAPPEGDAGTGMVATNSVAARTGNVSAGTSIFSMTVLEKPLSRAYEQIDMVATPSGKPVAMVHCANCTSDLNAWADTYQELLQAFGLNVNIKKIYDKLYELSLLGDADCGGMVVVNYLSGEHITGFEAGKPLVMRGADSTFTLPNFLKAQLYAAVSSLAIGMRILTDEKVAIDRITGHGGFFKAPKVGQQYLANALNTPVSVMETAGEGGAYGMAVLAAYRVQKEAGETLDAYLENKVFHDAKRSTLAPEAEGVKGFAEYLKQFETALKAERAAVEG
ncbi:MAG TPA: FGGY-family carbohydrate kinase [Candidatus Limiplasma sp.]|nr:FGGY-family carbohydrate kinase [Candidatus Limiplasma sp.]HRX08280.1 FGGY-family carbohydrate kinase [Candidatus Limiplasma sp.]